jgi:hypothetical protein
MWLARCHPASIPLAAQEPQTSRRGSTWPTGHVDSEGQDDNNRGVDWRIASEEVCSCNSDWGCPCQFEGDPTHGYTRRDPERTTRRLVAQLERLGHTVTLTGGAAG